MTLPKRILPISFCILLLSACGRLDSLPYVPLQTPQTWLQSQPYIHIGSIILVQPSTSSLVYLLGLLAIGVGLYFLKIRAGQRSRLWWGIALLAWGVGALLAGTSYEAFSYLIKCLGRPACLWTSWWEIGYLILSVWSINAMLLAGAWSSTLGRIRSGLIAYAIIHAVAYLVIVLVGAFLPVQFLISFELLLVVSTPAILALFYINLARFLKYKQNLDLVLLGAWVWLGITIGAYYLYYISGLTQTLWTQGHWFSENDVLHIGLIIWMLYLAIIVSPRLKDLAQEKKMVS